MAGRQTIPHRCSRCIAQPASVMLAPSGFSPAHVILVVFATPVNHKVLKSLNSFFGRALSPEATIRSVFFAQCRVIATSATAEKINLHRIVAIQWSVGIGESS
jgi:cytochrome b subunit of formate dehydrogenase